MFCGAGGSSEGLVEAGQELGREIDLVAVNHNAIAIKTHSHNHPRARHFIEDLRAVSPRTAVPSGNLDILLAGAPCPHHSNARGARSMDEQERALPREIHRWHEELNVGSMLIENVPRFTLWGPLIPKMYRNGRPVLENGRPVMVPDPLRKGQYFKQFISRIERGGYQVDWKVLNTANFGAATARSRLFIMAKKRGQITWPKETHSEATWRPASEIIDWSIPGKSIFHRKKPLAEATLERIASGMRDSGNKALEPFLIMLYGTGTFRSIKRPLPTVTAQGSHIGLCIPGRKSDATLVDAFICKYYRTGIMKSVSEPLDTVTTRDRFALLEAIEENGERDILFRMLQPHELSKAMGFRPDYWFSGKREDKIRQLGNAWEVVTAKKLCLAALGA